MLPVALRQENSFAVQRLLQRAAMLRGDSVASRGYLRAATYVMEMKQPLSAAVGIQIDDTGAADIWAEQPRHLRALQCIPGVGRSIARCLCQSIASVHDANSSSKGQSPSAALSYDDAFVHQGVLRAWLPHLNPRLQVHATGSYRRGSLSMPSLHVLMTDVDTRAADGDGVVQLQKIVQFLRHKRYVLGASPSEGWRAGVTLRASLDAAAVEVPCAASSNREAASSIAMASTTASEEEEAVPAVAVHTVALRFVPYDTFAAALLLTTGPAGFVAKLLLHANAKGYNITAQRGVTKCGGETPIVVKSEVELFRLIGHPYVHPLDRF